MRGIQGEVARLSGPETARLGLKLAEGEGFEPPEASRPRLFSRQLPSTGLGHPSAADAWGRIGSPRL